MKDIVRLATFILNLLFFVAFIVHISTIGYHMLYPNNPSIKIYEKELGNIDFPLSFKLCANVLNDFEKYNRIGYSNEVQFFYGRGKFNRFTHGWNGHTENQSTIGSVQGKYANLKL